MLIQNTNWISVKDRLPDRKPNKRHSHLCLVVFHGEAKILAYNHEHLCWDQEDLDDYFCDTADVEYWQPLPKLPNTSESVKLSGNKQSTPASPKCLCKEKGLHHKSTIGGVITSASLSLEINKGCPIHGHLIGKIGSGS